MLAKHWLHSGADGIDGNRDRFHAGFGVPGAGPIHLLILRVECRLDAKSVALFKPPAGNLHGDFVHLPGISHVKRAPERYVFGRKALTTHHIGERRLDAFDLLVERIHIDRRQQMAGHHLGVHHIRRRDSECREHRTDGKDVDAPDAELGAVGRGMDWPRAAERVDNVLLGHVTGPHHLTADQVRHLAVDHIVDAGRGLDRGRASSGRR